jgi:hypothetical protein
MLSAATDKTGVGGERASASIAQTFEDHSAGVARPITRGWSRQAGIVAM